jgi:signal peptidase II
MNIARRLLLILLVLVSCVGYDQASKSCAEARLPQAHALLFFAGTVRLQLTHNEGAFLSLGASLPKSWRQWLLRIGISCMLLALLAYALFFAPSRPSVIVAVGLLFAGGVSNLIDRFAHDGYVVDFINIGVGALRTGIFNVADVAITAGALMLFVDGLRARHNEL